MAGVISCLAALVSAAAPSESCFDLGFTSSLLCSSCNALQKHVEDATLMADCKKCCTPDSSGAGAGTYNSADLRICK